MDLRDPKERQAAFEKFLADYPNTTRKDQAHFQIAMSMREPERLAALEKFVVDFPKSGLAGQAYMSIFNAQVRKKPVDEARIQAVIDAYIEAVPDTVINIGSRTLNRRADAYNIVADRLMVNEVMLDKALDLIQKAVGSTTDKTYPSSKAMYFTTLGQVQFKRKEYDQAEESLKKAIATPEAEDSTGEAQLFLGKIYETRGNSEAALEAYLKAAGSTNSAELRASLEKSYVHKHGSLAGLHERIDASLLARAKPFEAGRYESKGNDKGTVVLAELFTGSECRPCLAADLGFDGLIEHYPRQTVVVLEYHLHIPGPDPMTNSDTEQRQKYYGVNSTPTVLFDGIPSGISGGSRSDALRNFNGYKGKIEPRLARQPQVKLSALSLKTEGDTVTVIGEVDASLAGAVAGKAKLRLALVEETVHYTGGNGLHFHHFVVRKMIGSSEGLALRGAEGKTRFSESASLSEVGVSLKDYLDNFEKNRSGFQWAEKLNQVNPKQIAVVAFVQNDDTKEVLQSAFIH
jgi:tetratricopeptide (TPR) repeat protein